MARDPKKLKRARDKYREKKAAEKAAKVAGSANKPTEREKMLVRRFKTWEACKAQLKELQAKENEKVNAKQAALRAACEETVPTGDQAKSMAKLRAVERAWQDLDEAKAERVENTKHAKDDVANAYRRLKEVAENASQLSLFAPDDSEEDKSEKEEEDDEDE